MNSLILKIRRGETPFYRSLHNAARRFYSTTLPLPRFLHPVLGFGFEFWQSARAICAVLLTYFVREPLFRGRCCDIGKNFHLERMPYVDGHAKIYIGDDVNFFGKVDIFCGRIFDEPKLIIGNRVDLGHDVLFILNKEILLEDDINVASGVRFMDTDAHPRDAAARIADAPPRPEEVKPVRIRRYAWIGHNVFIMKGVTIGEGAIIGVNSVVVTDIPPYSIAMGNPARVVVKNINQTATAPAAN
ncbi:MAG TPA: acyltransferase [Bryocella sp.]|nr:acyltransferase [Bryocella sp.]